MSMTIEKRFGIYIAFKNCWGIDIKVKTFWHATNNTEENLKQILEQSHYCMCQNQRHIMEDPLIVDLQGYIYYQADLINEGAHYTI